MESEKAARAACTGRNTLNALQQLESIGYRFKLEGDHVRYTLYGGQPPPEADALLRSLDREKVRTLLIAQGMGLHPMEPETLVVPWPLRYVYLHAIKAALDAGALLNVEVIYHHDAKETEYHLQPRGVDLTPWLGKEHR